MVGPAVPGLYEVAPLALSVMLPLESPNYGHGASSIICALALHLVVADVGRGRGGWVR